MITLNISPLQLVEIIWYYVVVGEGLIDKGTLFNEILSKTDKSYLIHFSGLKILLKLCLFPS